MPSCPECKAELKEGQAFCENCGARLQEGVIRREAQPRTVFPVSEQHKKHLRAARVAIMFVAVVTVIVAIVFWFILQNEIEKVKNNPMMFLNEDAVAMQKVAIASTFVLGLIFFGLFFWAKSNPFGASLTALLIYVASIIVSLGLDPESLPKGIIIKAIIILALVRGVQAGLAFKRLGSQP